MRSKDDWDKNHQIKIELETCRRNNQGEFVDYVIEA